MAAFADAHSHYEDDVFDVAKPSPVVPVPPPPARYEDRYLAKFERMQVSQLTDEQLDSFAAKYVIETTPRGLIIMMYNPAKNTFSYWSDKSMSYPFLEVAGRKFVTSFDCKALFVNMKAELERKPEISCATTTTTTALPPQPPAKSKFVQFKQYNQRSASAGDVRTNEPGGKRSDFTGAPIKTAANRYTSEGRVADFALFATKKRRTKKSKMSVAEYMASTATVPVPTAYDIERAALEPTVPDYITARHWLEPAPQMFTDLGLTSGTLAASTDTFVVNPELAPDFEVI